MKEKNERDHLFISYATEDAPQAAWIARKLAALGYAVWIDQFKILGGEPWPQTIDEAIKTRTFRMLALLSKSSISKPNPVKERTLALNVGRQLDVKDFLITMKADDSDLDWQTVDISYVSFADGWASGLRKLLKKLESIGAPRTLDHGAEKAAETFAQGEELILCQDEQLITNVLRVGGIPAALRVYTIERELTDSDVQHLDDWVHHKSANGEVLSLFPPPLVLRKNIRSTSIQIDWLEVERTREFDARTIAATLVIEIIRRKLIKAGFRVHPNRPNIVYLPEEYSADGKLHFVGIRGKQTWLKIRGRATFVQTGKPRETNYHHFALEIRLARGLDRAIWLQVRPTVFFFSENGEPIVDSRVGPRRRRLSRSWWNDKWANRLLAVESILSTMAASDEDTIAMTEGFARLTSRVFLDESKLDPILNIDESDNATSETVFILEPDLTEGRGNESDD